MDRYEDSYEYGHEHDNSKPNLSFMQTGMHVKKHRLRLTEEQLAEKIEDTFMSVCDSVEKTFNKHGKHPATAIGIGKDCSFQVYLDSMGQTPDPTACTFALLQYLARSDEELSPEGFILVVETIKCDGPPEDLLVGIKSLKDLKTSHELFVTVTSRNGYHKVCRMIVDDSDPNRHHITKREPAKFIYEVEDSPFADMWQVWNPDEDFGAEIRTDIDIGRASGMSWDEFMGMNPEEDNDD